MPLKSSAPACVTALANLVTNSVRCKAAAKPAAKLGCVPGRRLEESSGPLPPSIRCRTGAPSPPPSCPTTPHGNLFTHLEGTALAVS